MRSPPTLPPPKNLEHAPCLEIKFLNQLPQTILDKIVGTFSSVFFRVLKNFHNQELTCKTLSVR